MNETDNHRSDWIARSTALLPLLIFTGAATLVMPVMSNGPMRPSLPWVPGLDIFLSFNIDGLSLLFILIISAVGFFVTLYSVNYLHGHHQTGRFFLFLHAFMLSMLGLVCADNMMALFVFWELTTIFSYLLIGFEHEAAASRHSARQALLVTGAGGLALLAGFLLLQIITGTADISGLAVHADALRSHPLYSAIFVLIILGAFTKSAQFPFHFWLPNAMAAPTPISAFLHSATMVKGGIYLLARFHPILGGTATWTATLMITGAITAVGGAILAMGQSDLKKILAYTTITALGIMTMFLGGRATPSLTAAMTFLLVHSLYKSGLFLMAGIVDHQTGTRQLENLGGLCTRMPFTACSAVAACLSMAGFPLFFGFIGKEIMYKGALAETMCPHLAVSAAVLANALMTAVGGILIVRVFWGRPRPELSAVKEASGFMWVGPVVLGGIGIVFGIIPEWVGKWLVEPAVRAFHQSPYKIKLELYHGINMPLLLSVLTFILGGCFYLAHRPLFRLLRGTVERLPITSGRAYDGCIAGVAWLGHLQARLLQNGSLHRYLFIVMATFVVVTGYTWFTRIDIPPALSLPMLPIREWLLIALITAAVITVLLTRVLLLAICALGVIGAGLAIVFLSYGAPDVALTQLLVETLTVVIVSIILLKLPALKRTAPPKHLKRLMDGILAGAAGILVTSLLLAVLAIEPDLSLTAFFEQNSYLAAHGKNIVNVILVDFRSLDTMGEIIVVAAAGLAGFALIHQKRGQ
ncbi:MAG: hydrogen gas-evolving membrane-bound hydrogenase subunit E [Thermodesulfobacteriota bacterium]|nr:hydrogen gas-evolving membrane-bound hydrogenase subunit E [Thermodesulfobacteriota bacterium]